MNSISKDFKFFSLLKFALPTMVMMVFMSLYTIVDGIFISRLVGSLALSACNIVYPVLNILMAAGIMLATGGNAVIARKLGEGGEERACRDLTLIVLTGIILSIFFTAAGNLAILPICRALGATELLLGYCRSYLSVLLFFAPMCMLQMLFQSFFVTAGKPGLGLFLTAAGGLANMALDYIFMGPLQMGISGAALATGIGQTIPAAAGLLYFALRRSGLRFRKPVWDARMLLESCFNGSSEMVTNLSAAVVTYLFNTIMLRLSGEIGVAAITVVLYGQFLFNALYLGFSIGVAPVLSFNYGLRDETKVNRLCGICLRFVSVSALVITAAALLGSPYIARVFMKKGADGYALTARGCFLFAFNYLFAGVNILASGIFTALSDGKTSAFISFLRTFVFIIASALILPLFLGTDGVWLSIPLAEALTLIFSVTKLKKRAAAAACKKKCPRGGADLTS